MSVRADVLRAMDKRDRVGTVGVFELLTTGRTAQSGAITPGVGLRPGQAASIVHFLEVGSGSTIDRRLSLIARLEETLTADGRTAFDDLMAAIDPEEALSGAALGRLLADTLDRLIGLADERLKAEDISR